MNRSASIALASPRDWIFAVALTAMVPLPAPRAAAAGLETLRQEFAAPRPKGGTVTLWWLNGKLTKQEIRSQMLAMRDSCGFSGVAPLTLFRMKPATEPAYLSEDYFDHYGCILDTARELGMSVVFYDDCDFPSGTAGNRMRELHPEALMKYLARGRTTVSGPGEAVVPMPDGRIMSVVATRKASGDRIVVTPEASWGDAVSPLAGTSIGFRQPPEECARFSQLRVKDADGKLIFDETFGESGTPGDRWQNPGGSRLEPGGLRATDCLPMWAKDCELPARFTIETRFTILEGAAGLAFGVRGEDDHLFWQFNAGQKALRPHVRRGAYRLLEKTAFPFATDRPYDLRLVVDGPTIETWVDGKRIATHTLDAGPRAVRWRAPEGEWDVQAFVCATAPAKRFVDCLDPEAMRKFIGLTYDRFAERFPGHFGSTVKMSFFDDLATYHVPDCLLWTPSFNEKFAAVYGRSPESLYPALWEDIGPETEAARASLYGLRNELFAAGYPKVTQQWCEEHGMEASGHPAASYRANPLQATGDSILFYKYQGRPLTDYIHYHHHGIDGFKVPTSAAYNFDRPVVVCEIYGNFHQPAPNDSDMLYRAGMEMYARGVNFLLPHGTWWDPDRMRIVPEISWRNPAIGPGLPDYNKWAARCERLLRGGRHVADIGIVYPIADLAARYHVGLLPFTHGKDPVPGSDYYEVMRILTGELRRDFTMLHPETISRRCRVDGPEFLLDNPVNWERYRVLLLPACRTIHAANLEKAMAFADAGGVVVATTCVPEKSAEFGRDDDVQRLSRALFGPGGKGVFIETVNEETLRAALDQADHPTWDVVIENATEIPRRYRKAHDYGGKLHTDPDAYEGGNRQFAYIHKVVDGAEVYFFANSSTSPVAADVRLRGSHRLERWDPHSGSIEAVADARTTGTGDGTVTFLRLELPPVHSVFYVGRAR